MALTRVGVAGAAGRMGRALVAACAGSDDVALAAAVARPGSDAIGVDAGRIAGVDALDVPVSAALAEVLDRIDVLVDFTTPEHTLENLGACAAAGKPVVVGTTGFDAGQRAAAAARASEVAVVMAPNTSVGVHLALRLIEIAARVLGEDADVEIVEAHHRAKVDAPSGTALRIGEVVARARGRDLEASAVYGRHGRTGPRERGAIGFSAVRAGDIVGEHTVLLAGAGERLEITHRVASRHTFAAGALRAARWVVGRPAGLYGMEDVLGA